MTVVLFIWWMLGMMYTVIFPPPLAMIAPTLNQQELTQGWSVRSVRIGPGLLIEDADILPKPVAPSGLPLRLKIPRINVDAVVEYVGLTPDGAVDTPKNIDNVAWFELGQRPGENGSAIIDGHYGFKDGRPSVFDNLYKLRKGDTLSIENDRGEIISFIVQGTRRYDVADDASAVFSSDDGKSHLNLITCEGTWDTASGGYPRRLVVFTDKE